MVGAELRGTASPESPKQEWARGSSWRATAAGMSMAERMSPPGSQGRHTAGGEVEGVQNLSSLLSAFDKAELL